MNNSPFDLDPETGFDKPQNADPLGSSAATGSEEMRQTPYFFRRDNENIALVTGGHDAGGEYREERQLLSEKTTKRLLKELVAFL